MKKHTTPARSGGTDSSNNSNSNSNGQPVNQLQVNQSTTVVNQLTGEPVNQLTSAESPVPLSNQESFYPSRTARQLKGIRLPVQKLEKWEMWCFFHKVSFQDAVEKAMDWLTSQPVNQLAISCDHDDIDDVEIDDVIIIYQNLTKSKWKKPEDDEARAEVAQYDSKILQAGVALSVSRFKPRWKGDKINSFRYCFGAIYEIAESGANPADYLRYAMTKGPKME